MTRIRRFERPKAVLFDAGGVLITPPLSAHQALLGKNTAVDVHREFYATQHALSKAVSRSLADFWVQYAARVGLPASLFVGDSPQHHAMSRWNHATDNAAHVMRELVDLGLRVAVASNANGGIAELLHEAEVCHTESGPGAKIDLILDSGDIKRYPDPSVSMKPEPTMLLDAVRALEVHPHEALFVGDSVAHDAQAAARAGVTFVHLDPFAHCEDAAFSATGRQLRSKHHDHVRSMDDVLPYALGLLPRSTVATTPILSRNALV